MEQCEKTEDGVKVVLERSQLDNPHKEKTWKENGGYWPKDFAVEIFLTDPQPHQSQKL